MSGAATDVASLNDAKDKPFLWWLERTYGAAVPVCLNAFCL
ncbi:hypothetical protein ABIE33_003203 [Ensifer sp. 4252]